MCADEFPLHNAVYNFDSRRLFELLEDNLNPNRGIPTPLWVAAKRGFYTACELLLEYGAEINLTDYDGSQNTPLHMAVMGNHVDVVALLCRSGAAIHVTNAHGEKPINLVNPEFGDEIADILDYWGEEELAEEALARQQVVEATCLERCN